MTEICRKCARLQKLNFFLTVALLSTPCKSQSYKQKLEPQLLYSKSLDYEPPDDCYDKSGKTLKNEPICELLPNQNLKIVGSYLCSEVTFKEINFNDLLAKNYSDTTQFPVNYTDTTYLDLYEFSELEIRAVLNGTEGYIDDYVKWLKEIETNFYNFERIDGNKKKQKDNDDGSDDDKKEQNDTKGEVSINSKNQTSDKDDNIDAGSEPDLSYKRVSIKQALDYLQACKNDVCIEGTHTGARFSKYKDVKFINASYLVLTEDCCGPKIVKKKIPCTLDEYNHLNRMVKSNTHQSYADNYFNKRKGNHFGMVFMSSLFLGAIGVDRFMMNHRWLGLLKMATLGCVGLWWILDLILLICGVFVPADHSNWNPFV